MRLAMNQSSDPVCYDNETAPIEFLNPDEIDESKERCSKLLDPKSQFYQRLAGMRRAIMVAFPGRVQDPSRMDFHIEVTKGYPSYDKQTMLAVVKQLQGRQCPCDFWFIKQQGRALVIETPHVDGYGITHATIAYFPKSQCADWNIMDGNLTADGLKDIIRSLIYASQV